MMYITIRAALLAACVATSGCAYTSQMQLRGESIRRQTADFDEAVAASDRQMIVANVLRARDRESMSFSRLSILRGNLSREFTGGLSAELRENAGNDLLTPSIGVTEGSSPNFDLGVLNTQKFSRAIHSEIKLSTYHLLLAEGFQPGLLHMLFLSEMSLSCALIVDLNDAHARHRLVGLTPDDIAELRDGRTHCQRNLDPDGNGPEAAMSERERRQELVRFVNDPTDPDPSQFHHWLRILMSEQEAALTICPKEKETPVGPPMTVASDVDIQGIVAANTAGMSWREPSGRGTQSWRLISNSVDHQFALGCGERARRIRVRSEQEPPVATENRPESATSSLPTASFEVRSAHDVIQYLGQVVRVQTSGSLIKAPRIDMDNHLANGAETYEWQPVLSGTEDQLFVLRTHTRLPGVSVEHQDERYVAAYTPNGCPPDLPEDQVCRAEDEQDRTQQVIHIVLQLFGMLQEREDLPISTAVSITR